MILQDKQKQDIKEDFASLKTKEDLLALLNYSKKILYGDNCILFSMKHLTYHCNPKLNKHRYSQFSIKKKSGGERTINAPCSGLKAIQNCLNLLFQALYTPHKNAYGFIQGKSIVDNAQKHIDSNYVYNIDLKDFFPSVDQARVWGRLKHPPFNLNEKDNRLKLANIIASLCCHEMEVERINENGEWEKVIKRVLPQGAPTSPVLTNLICERLDYLLTAVAKRFGSRYSRYADDITFSSLHNVYQKDGAFLNELDRIIKEQGFNIKPSKTRLQKTGYRQEVTGLIVNEKVNVSAKYIKQLRKWIYYWETYGFDKANSFFVSQYKEDKSHIKKGDHKMKNIIAGKLEYLKMVKGAENSIYLMLNQRFDKLVFQNDQKRISSTLDIWESQGIEKAMDSYYNQNKKVFALFDESCDSSEKTVLL